jgi:uncharacterized protein
MTKRQLTPKQKVVIAKTVKYIQKKFMGEGTGHDWWHIERVWKNAKMIGETEVRANLFVVELGALLHDIADWKFNGGDLSAGPKEARRWLKCVGVDEETIHQVCVIVEKTSFKGAKVKPAPMSLEGMIVQDADRLDAIGAIGIARAFAYGGSKNREIYNCKVKPQLHSSFAQYKKSVGTSINHFHEKLLLLKDRMNTKKGRALAKKRHLLMEKFVENFYSECGDLPPTAQ